MSRIVVLIIFGLFLAYNHVSGRNLPGIDPSTMSVDPDPGHVKQPAPQEAKTGTPSEEQKKEQEQTQPEAQREGVDPAVTGLGVRRLEDKPYNVELTWSISPRNESPIYIARSTSPITTRGKLMESENITSPPLSPQAGSFIDENVPNGKYYYAVLTKNEIASRGNIILKKGVNISPEMVVILREDETKGPPIQKDDKLDEYRITGLSSMDQDGKVILKWLPAEATNIRYTVYRGITPLDTKERIDTSQRLGVVEEGKEEFEDVAPLNNRTVFYGVTVTDKSTDREITNLILRKSYIRHTFGSKEESKAAEFPGAIIVVLASAKSVGVHWTDPESSFDKIAVFRSSAPISSEEKLKDAVKISEVEKGIKKYEDAAVEPGNYYYAIFPMVGENIQLAFLEDRTYTTGPVTVSIPEVTEKKEEIPEEVEKIPEEAEKLPGEAETKPEAAELLYFRMITARDSVKLIWEISKYDQNIKFLIYRSQKFMQNFKEVQRYGQLVEELPAYIKEYVDESLPDGIYYYALVLERNKEIDEMLVAGKNYVLEPAIVAAGTEAKQPETVEETHEPEEQEPSEKISDGQRTAGDERADNKIDDEMVLYQKKLEELNRILAATFIKNKFAEAAEQLKSFTGDHAIPEGVRARAMFYSGLSYFNMRRYKQALFYFSNSEVRSYYPARSDFWIKRSVEKIR